MFDAQKLLGHVLKDAVGGQLGGSRRRKRRSMSGLPRGLETQVGMGLIALAVAAYEHFTAAKSPAPADAGPPPPPGQSPPPPPPASPDQNAQALHLLRAMISAANADGAIDAAERQAIVGRADEAGLSAAEVAALQSEFAAPLSLERLLAQTGPALREETYVAALVGMTADTDAETQFLARLADGLQLDAAAQARIRAQVGLS
jgi:uncharacterized membrane protein YebE (DUF533 family)